MKLAKTEKKDRPEPYDYLELRFAPCNEKHAGTKVKGKSIL